MKKDFLLSIVVAILLVFGVKTYYEVTLKLQQKKKFQMETKMKC